MLVANNRVAISAVAALSVLAAGVATTVVHAITSPPDALRLCVGPGGGVTVIATTEQCPSKNTTAIDVATSTALAALASRVVALETRTASQQAAIAALQTQGSAQQAAIAALQTQGSSQQTAIAALQAQGSAQQTDIAAVRGMVATETAARQADISDIRVHGAPLAGWEVVDGRDPANPPQSLGQGLSLAKCSPGKFVVGAGVGSTGAVEFFFPDSYPQTGSLPTMANAVIAAAYDPLHYLHPSDPGAAAGAVAICAYVGKP